MKRFVGDNRDETSITWPELAAVVSAVAVALAAKLTYEALYLILYAAIAILILRHRLRRPRERELKR
jgi:membrane protein implicated in regulation of membrane protease activity